MNKRMKQSLAVLALLSAGIGASALTVQTASAAEKSLNIQLNQGEETINLDALVSGMGGTILVEQDKKGQYKEYVLDETVIRIYKDAHVATINGNVESFVTVTTETGVILPQWAESPTFGHEGVYVPVTFAERVLEVQTVDGAVHYEAEEPGIKQTESGEESVKEETPAVTPEVVIDSELSVVAGTVNLYDREAPTTVLTHDKVVAAVKAVNEQVVVTDNGSSSVITYEWDETKVTEVFDAILDELNQLNASYVTSNKGTSFEIVVTH